MVIWKRYNVRMHEIENPYSEIVVSVIAKSKDAAATIATRANPPYFARAAWAMELAHAPK